MSRYSIKELNALFINGLGKKVVSTSDIDKKPFIANINMPYSELSFRVYLYNCTNPPGGRPINEYKSQIIVPGQRKGMRGNFDDSGNKIVVFAAYVPYGNTEEQGVFVLYDPMCHIDFAFSSNVQIKEEAIAPALINEYWESCKSNGEIVITATPQNLFQALQRRIEVISPALLRGKENET